MLRFVNEMRGCFNHIFSFIWAIEMRDYLLVANTPVCYEDDEDIVVLPPSIDKAC